MKNSNKTGCQADGDAGILLELEILLRKNKEYLQQTSEKQQTSKKKLSDFPTSQSYSMELLRFFLQGRPEQTLKKLGEEAGEVMLAVMKHEERKRGNSEASTSTSISISKRLPTPTAKQKSNLRNDIISETADLVFHLLIVLIASDIEWEEVCRELHQRRERRIASPSGDVNSDSATGNASD